jgi:lysozyme
MSIIPVVADLNHANSLNLTKLKAAGIVGIIHKARQGTGYGDPAYAARREAAESMGFLWGAYDFATHDDVPSNVAAFLATAKPGPQTSLWLDFEDNTHSQMTADQALEFLDRVSQKLGRACGIYGGNRIREEVDHQDSAWIDVSRTTPLWQCRYISGNPLTTADLFDRVPPIPPWTANFLIQYTGDGVGPRPHTVPGLEDGADLNAYDGTPEELTAAWVPTAEIPDAA